MAGIFDGIVAPDMLATKSSEAAVGNRELGVAKNLTGMPQISEKMYSPFGEYAATAKEQGWYPETSHKGETIYRSPYDMAFNNVVIPNDKMKGHIALVGHDNQKFDVVIRNKNGDILNYIYKGISPKDVQAYITNNSSVVAKRNNSIINGANLDKPDAAGNYVSLK